LIEGFQKKEDDEFQLTSFDEFDSKNRFVFGLVVQLAPKFDLGIIQLFSLTRIVEALWSKMQ
jgi:hypothetical protein